MPTQVIAAVERLFPGASSNNPSMVTARFGDSAKLRTILTLIDEIPPELLAITGADYVSLKLSQASLEATLAMWGAHRPGDSVNYGNISGEPITTIQRVLKLCPDEYPPTASTSDLTFIGDPDLRQSIRQDMADAGRAFGNGEWKGATVLAGAAIEALLLWAITAGPKGNVTASVSALQAAKVYSPKKPAPNDWDLHQFIVAAKALGIIDVDTETSADQARDFRNLIHPGKAARLGRTCDRGTAHVALGALDHVVRDLS